jgi:hypothetical protein
MRKVYRHECMYQKDRKISNQCPNATCQTLRKTRKSKFQNKQKRREIIKIRDEIETKTNKKLTKN